MYATKKTPGHGDGARVWEPLYSCKNLGTNARCFDRSALPSATAYFARELGVLKGGGTWKQALCPFHEDRSPSLSVNVETGGFTCFACGAKGDLLSFHMRRHSLDFKRAAQALGAWK